MSVSLSSANTAEARLFRTLLDDYVASLNALQAFTALGRIDPRQQGELATRKDEARDRLFLWGSPAHKQSYEQIRHRCLTVTGLAPSFPNANLERLVALVGRYSSHQSLETIALQMARHIDSMQEKQTE